MKAFILLSVIAVAFARLEECGENQHYESCGTACPLTCENYSNPPKACILMCNPGCHCDEGYVKTEDGRCVRPEECPAETERKCGENAHFESCGTACPLTCENYQNPPKVCILRCDIGCHCDNGYVKTTDGRCVRPEDCPAQAKQQCGKNEYYSNCGTACPLTCENYANPPKICPAMCVMGCHCEKGFVRTHDGRCVLPEECPAQGARPAQQTCLDKHETGMCKAYIPMWYYDVETGKCKKFIYGGCQGNGNRYVTEEECLEHCGAIGLRESSPEACDMPAETGRCRGYFPRFHFDRTTGECKKFIYGGCGGNDNNFQTIEDCQQTCDVQMRKSSPDTCDLPAETGVCRGFFPRFYFDRTTGQCQKFVYGGCGGNENNFETIEECQQSCGVQSSSDVCSLKKERGMCLGYFPRYHYNEKTGQCEKFIYGGCGGNENNFKTKEECEKACVSA